MARIVPEGGFGSRLKPQRTPRQRKESHLAFLRRLPCACCVAGGARPSAVSSAIHAAHVRMPSLAHGKEYTGKGEKPDDRWAVPLCEGHHVEQHSMSESEFWRLYGIDPFLLALVLWGLTGDEHAASQVLRLHSRR